MDNIPETRLRPALKPRGESRRLIFVHLYPHLGRETPLEGGLTLGRDPICGGVLDDASVSRRHARIEASPEGGHRVRDLGSGNGTFLNRRRVEGDGEAIRPGDVLRLGDVLLLLVDRMLGLRLDHDPTSPLIGGLGLAEVRRRIELLGPTQLRILVTGESGTGKELVAQDLHRRLGGTGPFVPINCAALPEQLVEAELFGHVQGAFTGAVRAKPGLFEAAAGGTLFLDEVAELPLPSQGKLLRVLESGEVRRVGAVSAVKTSCRILSATNRDVKGEIERGRFRGDLAARLAEAEIVVPPLRDRIEDLPDLVEHLAQRAGHALKMTCRALEALACYPWPLNVRELDNVVRMLSVLSLGKQVELSMLPEHLRALISSPTSARRSTKVARVVEALRQNNGNIRRASEALGVSRSYVYRYLDRSGLRPADFRDGTNLA